MKHLANRPLAPWAALIALAAVALSSTAAVAKTKLLLAIPTALAEQADDLPVSKKRTFLLPTRPADDAVVFGDYRVMQYRAGWTETTTRSLGAGKVSVFEEKSWRKFSFELQDPTGARLPVACAQREESRGLGISRENGSTQLDVPWRHELRCTLSPPPEGVWELAIAFGEGELTGPAGERFAVAASNELAGSRFRPPTPVGFLFVEGDQPVAAVEVMSKGRFVLSRELPPATRSLVAAASVALLLADLHG